MVIVFIPTLFNGLFSANVSFGGTSVIIIVGVTLETLEQIESYMQVRKHEGFPTTEKWNMVQLKHLLPEKPMYFIFLTSLTVNSGYMKM